MTTDITARATTAHPTPRVALFTLTMNRLEYTTRMLESLVGSSDIGFDHFIIDNGSTDGTQEYLSAHAERFAGLQLNEHNIGLPGGWNAALDLIGDDYDYLVKFDNDCEVLDHGWLDALVEVCEAKNRRMILSPRVEGLGPDLDGGHPRHAQTTICGRPVGLTNHVGGICLFVPKEAYAGFRFGKAPLHGNQDVRFSLHARLDLGWEMGYIEDVRVNHMDDTMGQVERYPEYWQQRAEQKWRVHGEHPAVTAAMRLPRRAVLLWRMNRGGLIEEGLGTYLLDRVHDRYHAITGRGTPAPRRRGDGAESPKGEVRHSAAQD